MKIIISILFISLLIPCSCLEPPPPEEAYHDADVVFSGEVINITLDESNYLYQVTFQTIDVWKGEMLDEIIILTETDSAMCGYNFQTNNEYLVYGYIYANEFYTNICTRTNLLDYAHEDLAYLNGLNDCEAGYTDINGLCFYDGDIEVLQKLIDNSVNSGVGDDCDPYDSYCGSPNPYMDELDAWFWIIVDGVYYQSGTDNGFQNGDGIVDPLELGLQEWENGRLTSLMCGAYIYCQLSGPIPEEIDNASQLTVLRLEYNYLSGFVPNTICNLSINNNADLEFDLTGNQLCPPYPECISTNGFWSQDTSSCSEIGDLNSDANINIQDIIILISFIINLNSYDYQELIASDINFDGILNVIDVVILIDLILNP